MNKSVVITGEASETDSEEECHTSVNQLAKSVQGAVVTGEDSESDNEIDKTIASAISVLNVKNLDGNGSEVKYDSLFHQKLREHNEQLSNGFDNLCQSTVNEASKNLNVIDQHLLRSQITMQNAVTSLKSLSINSLTIKSKLHSLLSSNFLLNVTLSKD